jgi:hypothetical protein
MNNRVLLLLLGFGLLLSVLFGSYFTIQAERKVNTNEAGTEPSKIVKVDEIVRHP